MVKTYTLREFPERFAKDRIRFPTSRVQSFWMIDPLDESISCFLIKVNPWVLVPITFRGLYVLAIRGLHILACRGLHALAFRGLRVLIFSVLHIHTLREYKMLHRDLRSRFLLSVLGPPPDIGGRPTVREHLEREAITHLLCIPGKDFTRAAAKRRVWIMRTNMTTLTWIWMTLLFSNILPSDHNANLPLKMDRAHKTPSRPEEVQQNPGVSSSGYGPLSVLQGARPPQQGIAPARHPVDPKKSNRVLELPNSNYGPLSVLRSACRPQQGHQAPYYSSFHQEVLRPQVGAGRNTTAARGWPAAGNRRTAITSRVHLSSSTKRLERCLRPMADQ
ncbi:hypothetical protein HKD37_20G056250 [Glycine soja]